MYCRARSKIIIVDCDYSLIGERDLRGNSELALSRLFALQDPGLVVLTASISSEDSYETSSFSKDAGSLFTRTIVDGLSTGEADTNQDGLVTVTDLYHHAFDVIGSAGGHLDLWRYKAEREVPIALNIRSRLPTDDLHAAPPARRPASPPVSPPVALPAASRPVSPPVSPPVVPQRERGRAKHPRPSTKRSEDAVTRAVRAAVKPGLLTFNPPTEMIQGQWERVEVGIARSPELRDALVAGLRGRGEPQFEQISTSSVMSVELSGPSFEVISYGPAEQVVPKIARWEFNVRPYRAGHQTLTLCVCLRVDLPTTMGGSIAIPVLEREIRIRVSIAFSVHRFLAGNWQWLIATALGLGGALTAWITLFR